MLKRGVGSGYAWPPMSTSLAHLALYLTDDCDAKQARAVQYWSACAIAMLVWQFDQVALSLPLALAAVVGSLIGLFLCKYASNGSRDIRKSIAKISAVHARDVGESRATVVLQIESAKRNLRRTLRQALSTCAALFGALGIVHDSLASRLFPRPVFSRA